MEFILYFMVLGSGIMYFILKFDAHQNKRMRKLYKDNEQLKPLFLMKAADRKLKTLSTRLYGNDAPASYTCEECVEKITSAPKQVVARQLGELVTEYNDGKITVQNYNSKLNEMLSKVRN